MQISRLCMLMIGSLTFLSCNTYETDSPLEIEIWSEYSKNIDFFVGDYVNDTTWNFRNAFCDTSRVNCQTCDLDINKGCYFSEIKENERRGLHDVDIEDFILVRLENKIKKKEITSIPDTINISFAGKLLMGRYSSEKVLEMQPSSGSTKIDTILIEKIKFQVLGIVPVKGDGNEDHVLGHVCQPKPSDPPGQCNG